MRYVMLFLMMVSFSIGTSLKSEEIKENSSRPRTEYTSLQGSISKLYKKNDSEKLYTPIWWGQNGTGPCGGYCNGINSKGDCPRDRRPCYENGECKCCSDNVCR